MSVLIPFNKCIARPNDCDKEYLLKDHLLGVKKFAETIIQNNDFLLARMTGLAGLCHDIAKAHRDWQAYIIKKPGYKKGPHHAPAGAFLFTFLAYHLLRASKCWDHYKIYWLWLVRDINDHHGRLKKIEDNHWMGSGDWDKMDMSGIEEFIKQHYSEFANIEISEESLNDWATEIADVFENALGVIDLGYAKPLIFELMNSLQQWRYLTVQLIAGDRLDIINTVSPSLSKEDHIINDQKLDDFCAMNNNHPMSMVRKIAQKDIIAQLKENPDEIIYTLEMPTGYGKTITALKLANWLGINRDYQKIIYVAPYLSILEQTSKVVEEAMGKIVLEHHSLAFIEQKQESNDEIVDNISQNHLVMEAWAHSIVCTSFQQWSKAMFPARAQDVIRRVFLSNSVVIIDEPQIFNPEGWNVFLSGLESMANLYNLRIFFLSATMPPFHYGLSKIPHSLFVNSHQNIERYRVVRCENMGEVELGTFIRKRNEKTQAAILNTVEDAYRVFKELRGDTKNIKLLHGLMIPIHKKIEISKIQGHLKNQRDKELTVVSTQVLEAGVDVSFQHVVRALPILPSVVQAAGRVNRHYEDTIGTVSLVPFFRDGKKNTRNYIYKKELQSITDKLLEQKEVWLESEMLQLIKDYYQEMFQRNTYETGKQAIYDAYEGDWPRLSTFQPFGEDDFRLPVFIPWEINESDTEWIPVKFKELQRKFGFITGQDIYDYYLDKKQMQSLSFAERKEFMILFHYFVVNVPAKLAISIANKEDFLLNRIPIIFNSYEYSTETGLAGRMVNGFDNCI